MQVLNFPAPEIITPPPESGDMALGNTTKDFIRDEINEQLETVVEKFNPHGWRKITYWAREWGIAGTIVMAFLALVAITLGALYQSFGHVTEETKFRTTTETRLTNIESSMRNLDSSFRAIRLSEASSDPTNLKNIAQVKQVLNDAISHNVIIDENAISEAGNKFLEAAKTTPSAWDAATACLNYKSFLNTSFPGIPTIGNNEAQEKNLPIYHGKIPIGWKMPMLTVVGAAPKEQSAELGVLGEDLNAKIPQGFRLLVLEGGGLILDGMKMKDVVLRNVHLIYQGTPVALDNVYFVDCTFDIQRNPEGQHFAMSILSQIPVIFKAGS